jgi:NAD(P)-dependent dehydrogenase (short-subunit alcohol dehydrogenase family)
MTNPRGGVAVVTGAASGIGRSLADRFAREGMRVVMADVEHAVLEVAANEVRSIGTEVLAVRTDVTSSEQVRALSNQAFSTFGRVDVLCANAGVSSSEGRIWETTERELEWVMRVNLFGVVHAIREFVPRMIAAESEGHIVVTASNAGLHSGPGLNIYGASKVGVFRVAEGLHYELRQVGSKLNVSILVPGTVRTGIVEAERNRPNDLADELPGAVLDEREARREMWRRGYEGSRAISPAAVADQTWDAILDNRFYVFTHPSIKQNVRKRTEDIVEERTPEEMPLYAEG